MRAILSISAVLTCGAIATASGFLQAAPSHAASIAPAAIATGPGRHAGIGTDPELIRISRSGSVEAHFAAANTTHDGHLTREQAVQGDWSRVAKHFDEIDTDHKGWISVAEIHAFNKEHHKHRRSQPS